MRRGEVFWGFLLVILGGLFLLKTAGYVKGAVFGWFWPFFMVSAGVWILLGGFAPRTGARRTEGFSVPLQGAKEASLQIEHGAGQVEVRAGASGADFLWGTGGVGMKQDSHLSAEKLDVRIEAGPSFIPWLGPEGGVWRYWLNPEVPTALSIRAGACHLDVDLTDLHVTQFSFEGGASSLDLRLPTGTANTVADIRAGAASIKVHVPEGVSARLRVKSVGSLDVNQTRFPPRGPDLYQSADYDSASRRADIVLDGGATSIRID